MISSIQHFIFDYSWVPLGLVCLLGVAQYRRLDLTRRYLVWMSLLALVVTALSYIIHHYYKQPNLFLAPIDTVIEFTFLALMYQRTLRPMAVARYLPLAVGLFWLGSALSYRPSLTDPQFSPIQHFIESVVVLMLVMLYFRRIIRPPSIPTPLEREPMFWVSAGLLLYFGSSTLIFLTSNITLNSLELSRSLWTIHAVFYAFLNVFYLVALCVNSPLVPDVTQT